MFNPDGSKLSESVYFGVLGRDSYAQDDSAALVTSGQGYVDGLQILGNTAQGLANSQAVQGFLASQGVRLDAENSSLKNENESLRAQVESLTRRLSAFETSPLAPLNLAPGTEAPTGAP